MKKNATLTRSLLVRKGEASPVLSNNTQKSEISYYKSMTFKLDRSRYEQLKIAGINMDKKSQEIFLEALDLWFSKNH